MANKSDHTSTSVLPSNIVEFHPDPILVVDGGGKVMVWNKAMETMTGVKAETVLGKGNYEHAMPFYGVRKPLLVDMVGLPAEEINDGYTGVVVREGRLEAVAVGAKLKGKDVVLWCTAGRLYGIDGKAVGAVESIRDISGRAKITEKLRQQNAELSRLYGLLKGSEEKYRLIATSTNDGIITLGLDGIITYVNPKGMDILGLDTGHIVGRYFTDFVTEEYRAIAIESFGKGIQGEPIVPFEIEVADSKGGRTPVELSGGSIHGSGGERQGAIVSFRNVSERKKAREELKKAHEELERRVEERTAELKEAKEQAELYLDLMGHDINNKNQVAMGYLEMARGTLSLDDSTTVLISRSLAMLQDSSRLIEIVGKIQQVVGGSMKLEKVDVNAILVGTLAEYSIVPGRDIAIRYELSEGCSVRANQLLKDVFSNIVGNAVKHSTGPLNVTICMNRRKKGPMRYYEIAIEDNGPGIPDGVKCMLFSRAKRGATKAKGSGLGLYLVKTLVEGFSGRVWVEDRVPGDYTKGCRFIIWLPAAE